MTDPNSIIQAVENGYQFHKIELVSCLTNKENMLSFDLHNDLIYTAIIGTNKWIDTINLDVIVLITFLEPKLYEV